MLGLGGLLSTFGRWETLDEIFIWGGLPAIERVQSLIYQVVFRRETPPVPIYFMRTKPDEILFQGRKFSVRAFPVSHRGRECYGYIFEEDSRRPFPCRKRPSRLACPKARSAGNSSPVNSIVLPNGRIVHPDEVLGDTIQGALKSPSPVTCRALMISATRFKMPMPL